jgi:hypothetical protein
MKDYAMSDLYRYRSLHFALAPLSVRRLSNGRIFFPGCRARPGFPGLKENFFIFEHLLRHFLPRLHAHFEAQMIITSAYATKVLH